MLSCQNPELTSSQSIEVNPFYAETDSQSVIYTLKNNKGMEVEILNYGAILRKMIVPISTEERRDVILGFDTLEEYMQDGASVGAVVGRYANRIANAKFELDGHTYQLAKNLGNHSLHGGTLNFGKHFWKHTPIRTDSAVGVVLTRMSPEGEEGFPGNLQVKVTYLLNNANELSIHYEAETDKATPINLTNHAYFNLDGYRADNCLKQSLQIFSENITEVDEEMIPTGRTYQVEGTPFDFRTPKPIGRDISASSDVQLVRGNGYDHNFVFNHTSGRLQLVATAASSNQDLTMQVYTTEPGMQLYTSNWMNNLKGKDGVVHNERSSFCLETQHFPDSPNQPNFPNTILRPNQLFKSITSFHFGDN